MGLQSDIAVLFKPSSVALTETQLMTLKAQLAPLYATGALVDDHFINEPYSSVIWDRWLTDSNPAGYVCQAELLAVVLYHRVLQVPRYAGAEQPSRAVLKHHLGALMADGINVGYGNVVDGGVKLFDSPDALYAFIDQVPPPSPYARQNQPAPCCAYPRQKD